MTEGRATARFVRGSAQKAKLVLDLIRGRDVNTALATLRFSRKSVARDVSKVLRSAVANAQQKDGASGDVDRLFVGSCYANQGPAQKRIRAAAMGRAFRIIKRTSHLTVVVNERAEVVRVPVSAPAEEPLMDAAPKKAAAKKSRPGGQAMRKTAKTETGTKARVVEEAKSTDD